MAPVSILPGRVRFESQLIVGKMVNCRYLNESINGIDGVLDSFINHRTGRILVRFNENLVDKKALTLRIKEIMKFMPHKLDAVELMEYHKKWHSKDTAPHKLDAVELMAYHKKWHSKDAARHALHQRLIAAAAHIILPKPLNLLFPMVIDAIRR